MEKETKTSRTDEQQKRRRQNTTKNETVLDHVY